MLNILCLSGLSERHVSKALVLCMKTERKIQKILILSNPKHIIHHYYAKMQAFMIENLILVISRNLQSV